MDPAFEQASQLLDQAILFYSGGQIEEASQYMERAAATLHQIQLASPEPKPEPVDLELATVMVYDAPPPTKELPAPAAIQPVKVRRARASSLAVAA